MEITITTNIENKMLAIIQQWEENPQLAPEHIRQLKEKEKQIRKQRVELKKLYFANLEKQYAEAQVEAIKQLQNEQDNLN